MITNNIVNLTGIIESEPEFSHEILGEGFYTFMLNCARKSGSKDILPVMVSDRLVDINKIERGQIAEIKGQIRSFDRHEDGIRSKLILSIFAREAYILGHDSELVECETNNNIVIKGYICKPPVYRCTPKGREIADVLLAVNRAYGKSDYIPCITWGRNARFTGGLEVGMCVQIEGRFQSREYTKKIGENEVETRTTYEVSASRIEFADKENGDEADA